jgi:rubrerythrin
MSEPRKPETEKRKVEASVHICRGPVMACINGDHSQCTDTIDVRQFEREAWERGRQDVLDRIAVLSAAMAMDDHRRETVKGVYDMLRKVVYPGEAQVPICNVCGETCCSRHNPKAEPQPGAEAKK